MKLNNITKLKVEYIINNSLFNKSVIDERTYSLVNEILLKRISKAKGYINNELL